MRLFLGIMLVFFFGAICTEKNENKALLFTYAAMTDIVALVALSFIR